MSGIIYNENLKKYIIEECPDRRPYPEGGRPGYQPSRSELAYFTQEYADYLSREDCWKIHQFPLSRWISEDVVDRWAKQFEPLHELMKLAPQIIGSRREVLALQGKIDRSIVMKTMGIYDRSYRKFMKFESALKSKEENAKKPQVIVMEKFPEVK